MGKAVSVGLFACEIFSALRMISHVLNQLQRKSPELHWEDSLPLCNETGEELTTADGIA